MTASTPWADIVRGLRALGLDGAALHAAIAGIERARGTAAVAGMPDAILNEPDTDGRVVHLEAANADTEPDKPATAGERPVAMARKALGLVAGLSVAARRVGSALLDHFNRTTGRCDPGEGRLARILGVSERTVRRAIRELEASGLVAVTLHGGRAHCNAYRPDLGRLMAITEAWDAGMRGAGQPANRPVSAGQPDRLVRQTHVRNPDSPSVVVESQRARPLRRPRDPRQREMLLPLAGGALEAAQDAAHRRLYDSAHSHLLGVVGREAFPSVMGAIPQDAWDSATRAEAQRRGTGLAVLLHGLTLPRPLPRAGPPVARETG